jgi:carbamoyl-phosphate synthase large subunit
LPSNNSHRPPPRHHADEKRRRSDGHRSHVQGKPAKCLRSLEIGRSGLGGDGKPWRIGTEVYGDRDILPRDVISRKLSVPNAERIFFIRHALRAGFTVDEIFNLTKIDRWFLVQIKEIVDFEEELAGAKN